MLVTRLREGEDLKQAIEAFVIKQNVSAATVISAVGSLNTVTMRMAGAAADKQDIRTYEGRFEIVSLIGNLGPQRTHLHIAVAGVDGIVRGGHLKEGSLVHTTVELVLAVDDTLTFGEENDLETGFGELLVQSK